VEINIFCKCATKITTAKEHIFTFGILFVEYFLWAAICCTTYTSVTEPCGCAATLCHAVKRHGSNFL